MINHNVMRLMPPDELDRVQSVRVGGRSYTSVVESAIHAAREQMGISGLRAKKMHVKQIYHTVSGANFIDKH